MTAPEIKTNLEHGYYNNVQPEDMVAQHVIPASRVEGAAFEFAELVFDGARRLITICPITVANGPGRQLSAVK